MHMLCDHASIPCISCRRHEDDALEVERICPCGKLRSVSGGGQDWVFLACPVMQEQSRLSSEDGLAAVAGVCFDHEDRVIRTATAEFDACQGVVVGRQDRRERAMWSGGRRVWCLIRVWRERFSLLGRGGHGGVCFIGEKACSLIPRGQRRLAL
ncbi:hypothetical protein VTI74DRAFT_1201 [Chaetomium olivicolor]